LGVRITCATDAVSLCQYLLKYRPLPCVTRVSLCRYRNHALPHPFRPLPILAYILARNHCLAPWVPLQSHCRCFGHPDVLAKGNGPRNLILGPFCVPVISVYNMQSSSLMDAMTFFLMRSHLHSIFRHCPCPQNCSSQIRHWLRSSGVHALLHVGHVCCCCNGKRITFASIRLLCLAIGLLRVVLR
jgi:hypothetical protein